MKKYLLALSLFVDFSCNAIHHQAADIVFDLREDTLTLHIGWYFDANTYVITNLDGPDKGFQKIQMAGTTINSSRNFIFLEKGFIHYYNGFNIRSSDDEQRITLK